MIEIFNFINNIKNSKRVLSISYSIFIAFAADDDIGVKHQIGAVVSSGYHNTNIVLSFFFIMFLMILEADHRQCNY